MFYRNHFISTILSLIECKCDVATPAPLIPPIECCPVGGRASGVPLYIYIYPNDIFEVDKILFKKYFHKNQLSMPDSRPKEH